MHTLLCDICSEFENFQSENALSLLQSRVNNKRGECLMLYSPVIDDCAEVKRLLFCVMYRLLVFVRFVTEISLAAP